MGGITPEQIASYQRDGAAKVSDHWVRSPLLNINRACQTCHHFPEQEIQDRVAVIQERNHALLQRAATALMAELDAIQQKAARTRTGLSGTLRVAIPVEFGTAWLGRAIAEFAKAQAERLERVASDPLTGVSIPLTESDNAICRNVTHANCTRHFGRLAERRITRRRTTSARPSPPSSEPVTRSRHRRQTGVR